MEAFAFDFGSLLLILLLLLLEAEGLISFLAVVLASVEDEGIRFEETLGLRGLEMSISFLLFC